MLKILQLSDVHFQPEARHDVDAELREGILALAPEIRSRFKKLDTLIVCGDVANSGAEAEYARAQSFLRDVIGYIGAERVFTVPGNHDVDQSVTDNAQQRKWRSSVRAEENTAKRNKLLKRLLDDDESGPGLLAPLEQYREFAAEFGCDISRTDPCWVHELEIGGECILRLFGLTSVLVSDQHDKTDRLAVGDFQLADVLPEDGVVNATLCHHPFCWLLDGDEQRTKLDKRSALHVTGHVHRNRITPTTLGLHVSSGALQPDRTVEGWEPSANIIELTAPKKDASTATLGMKVWTARWDPEADRFRLPEDPEKIVTHDVPPPVKAPGPAGDGDRAMLAGRLARLAPGDRVLAAERAGLTPGSIADLPSYEQPRAIVDRAGEAGDLADLWSAVHDLSGGQGRDVNPFKKRKR